MIDFNEMNRRGEQRNANRCGDPFCSNCGVTTTPHTYVAEPIFMGLIRAGTEGDDNVLLTAREAQGIGEIIAGLAERLDVSEAQTMRAVAVAREAHEHVKKIRKSLRILRFGDALTLAAILIVVGTLLKLI